MEFKGFFGLLVIIHEIFLHQWITEGHFLKKANNFKTLKLKILLFSHLEFLCCFQFFTSLDWFYTLYYFFTLCCTIDHLLEKCWLAILLIEKKLQKAFHLLLLAFDTFIRSCLYKSLLLVFVFLVSRLCNLMVYFASSFAVDVLAATWLIPLFV